MKNPSETEESAFLEGSRSRWRDLRFALRLFGEFITGFRALHFVGPCVAVFGSAQIRENNRYFRLAYETGKRLATMGFTVMTGGGPGVMSAANQGATEAGGHSVGCNIILPFEQHFNPFIERAVTLRYFFVRKVLLVKYSYAFVVLPGGIGTLDELFEAMTLRRTKKMQDFPIILLGKEYWTPLLRMIEMMIEEGTAHQSDKDMLFLTDSVDEAEEYLRVHVVERFGLQRGRTPKKSKLLMEH